MKQHAQHIPTKLLAVVMAGVVGVGFATAAMATGGGAGAQAVASNKALAAVYADAHMSTFGSAFSNAQWQSSATRGAERAAERMDTDVDGLGQSTVAGLEAAGKATATAERPGTR